ncbi:OCIA domain-containing protein 1 isoform X2 [Carassius gibelio]|uniref:OCIA domain-containing protein 1 isoform X1 n=1 Tax=Carassius gibelio TaxID=101364 RepID=UPI002279913A|nr:OCIA domain-containing protein 1 isoform X1 [Carassius gibelio]XP_052431704.1 OCIA domain-containing protein 1 isoform X2 [Carassius gibelio]
MSQQSPTDPERPGNAVLGPTGIGYIPTEEERRVFRECYQESFWYRSLPISVISMGFTQLLISRGALTASGRFGSLPKVAIAGVLGYLGGKMSYVKTCQEKFKSLENSPLGEALRQRQRHQPPVFTHKHPELSGPNKPDFEPTFQLDDQRNQSFSYTSDFTYSDPMSPATHSDTQITAEPNYIEEDVQKKHMLYEELRSKNRENYEVMTPKPETLLMPSAETNPAKRGKKNIYGDTWEE